jgi:hypothetical protein
LDDYSPFGDAQSVSGAVRKAIKSLPKLDTAERPGLLESELQTVTEDTAQLTSTIESRTGKIIEQVVHDSLKPRIDPEAQIEAIKTQ